MLMDIFPLPFPKNLRKNPCFKNLRKILRRYLAASVVFFLCFVCLFVNKISLRSLRTKSIDGVVLGLRSELDVVPLEFLLLLWVASCGGGDGVLQ